MQWAVLLVVQQVALNAAVQQCTVWDQNWENDGYVLFVPELKKQKWKKTSKQLVFQWKHDVFSSLVFDFERGLFYLCSAGFFLLLFPLRKILDKKCNLKIQSE